jgi:hypothetical protein
LRVVELCRDALLDHESHDALAVRPVRRRAAGDRRRHAERAVVADRQQHRAIDGQDLRSELEDALLQAIVAPRLRQQLAHPQENREPARHRIQRVGCARGEHHRAGGLVVEPQHPLWADRRRLRGPNEHHDVAEPQLVARGERRRIGDPHAVQPRAVVAAQVAHRDEPRVHRDLRVTPRDARVLDVHVRVGGAAHDVDPLPERESDGLARRDMFQEQHAPR